MTKIAEAKTTTNTAPNMTTRRGRPVPSAPVTPEQAQRLSRRYLACTREIIDQSREELSYARGTLADELAQREARWMDATPLAPRDEWTQEERQREQRAHDAYEQTTNLLASCDDAERELNRRADRVTTAQAYKSRPHRLAVAAVHGPVMWLARRMMTNGHPHLARHLKNFADTRCTMEAMYGPRVSEEDKALQAFGRTSAAATLDRLAAHIQSNAQHEDADEDVLL